MLRSTILAAIAACAFVTSASAATLPKAAITAGYDDLAPFSQRLDIVLSSGFGNGTFTVPAGVRLVIDYISADIGCAPGGSVLFDVATYLNGAEVEVPPAGVPQRRDPGPAGVLGELDRRTSTPIPTPPSPSRCWAPARAAPARSSASTGTSCR